MQRDARVRQRQLSYLSYQISSLSKARYYHIRQLRRIRPYRDYTTVCDTVTFVVHTRLDYCNFITRSSLSLQQIQNFLARAISLKLLNLVISLDLILRSVHWLKITERIEYKLQSLTYKVLTATQPLIISITSSLFNLLTALALHLSSSLLATSVILVLKFILVSVVISFLVNHFYFRIHWRYWKINVGHLHHPG